MNPEVSICIPTYNRRDKVIRQVEFFIDEISAIDCFVELIVRDNGSNDRTTESLRKRFNNENVKIGTNEKNIGLIDNIKTLASEAKGDYIWFVGDDDELYKGILQKVIDACQSNQGLIFINHRALNLDGKVELQHAFIPKKQVNLYEIFRFSGPTMMFITACVYKKKLIDQILCEQESRLTLPLYMSLYCYELEGITYIEDNMIDNYWGDTSWQELSTNVFGYQLPKELIRMILISKQKVNVIFSLLTYLIKRRRVVAKHIFKFKK